MEIPAQKTLESSQDATKALLDIARLLGKQAAKDLVDASQAAHHVTTLHKDEGAKDD